jgi:Domain of unknown function (DUF4386)
MQTSTLDRDAGVHYHLTTPDQSWNGLYRAGGAAAVLFALLTIVYSVVAALTPQPPTTGETGSLPGGAATMQYIADDKAVYVLNMVLFIAPVTLSLIVFLALFVALSPVSRSVAAIGSLIGVAAVVLCVTPATLLFGLVPLADQYASAATTAQQAAIATTADGLIAQINAVSLGGVLYAIGVLVVSVAMLKGIFHWSAAYLGIATGVVGVVCECLRPVIGAGYGVYGIMLIWLLVVGWQLWRLGGRHG